MWWCAHVHDDRSQWGHGREHEKFAPDVRREMQNHGLSSEFDEGGRRHWGEQSSSGWRPGDGGPKSCGNSPLEHQGAVHAAPTRQQQHRRLCLRMRERLAARMTDGEAGRAVSRRRARQQPGGTNSSPESDVQDNAVAEPQSAAQRRRADATRSDSEEREQGTVPVRGRRGLRQRRRRSGGAEQETVLMRGRKRLRQRRSSGAADRGHRDNAQRPSMLRSAALTTIAVLMASTAAPAEPHGSPGVAGAQSQTRKNSGADGTDGTKARAVLPRCIPRPPPPPPSSPGGFLVGTFVLVGAGHPARGRRTSSIGVSGSACSICPKTPEPLSALPSAHSAPLSFHFIPSHSGQSRRGSPHCPR
jgi:hypothetical protein